MLRAINFGRLPVRSWQIFTRNATYRPMRLTRLSVSFAGTSGKVEDHFPHLVKSIPEINSRSPHVRIFHDAREKHLLVSSDGPGASGHGSSIYTGPSIIKGVMNGVGNILSQLSGLSFGWGAGGMQRNQERVSQELT